MVKVLVSIVVGLFLSLAHAADRPSPLPSSDAFKITAEYHQPGLLLLRWDIAPTYYLYRHAIILKTAPDSRVEIGAIGLPQGIPKQDTIHGHYEAYTGQLIVPVPLQQTDKGVLHLLIRYQGCAESGFCYPVIKQLLNINVAKLTPPVDVTYDLKPQPRMAPPPRQQATVEGWFEQRSLLFIILSFLGLGVLLAFTPCVLPMVPILSAIIVGHSKKPIGIRKTFLLSLAYVLGMAITYAMAGMLVASLGSSLQVQMQRPWVIILFSGLFALLALSLFGLYELRLPKGFQRRITAWSNRQKGGSYISVFFMGSLSSLIISPCVSPPLIGVLSYIASSGNVMLGALALLALGLGMGLPLLVVGLSAGHLLPKAGAWMGAIEKIMGVMMLAFAIWILSRVVHGPVILFLWSVLAIISAVFLGLFTPAHNDFQRLCRGLGLVLCSYGIILMMGAALGNNDVLQPWQNWKVVAVTQSSAAEGLKPLFALPRNMGELDAMLDKAAAEKKVVLLDFYADWCASCVKLDKEVFATEVVKNALSDVVVLRANITENDDFSQALLRRFQVVAPPTILFFNREGRELADERLVGEITAEELVSQINQIKWSIVSVNR